MLYTLNPVVIISIYIGIKVYVAVPRQDSMSPVRVNAVLSGHCNIFVGYP